MKWSPLISRCNEHYVLKLYTPEVNTPPHHCMWLICSPSLCFLSLNHLISAISLAQFFLALCHCTCTSSFSSLFSTLAFGRTPVFHTHNPSFTLQLFDLVAFDILTNWCKNCWERKKIVATDRIYWIETLTFKVRLICQTPAWGWDDLSTIKTHLPFPEAAAVTSGHLSTHSPGALHQAKGCTPQMLSVCVLMWRATYNRLQAGMKGLRDIFLMLLPTHSGPLEFLFSHHLFR